VQKSADGEPITRRQCCVETPSESNVFVRPVHVPILFYHFNTAHARYDVSFQILLSPALDIHELDPALGIKRLADFPGNSSALREDDPIFPDWVGGVVRQLVF
jgi:hypothetical protein